jgi:polysaccharide export outer membrane protein
VAVIGRLTPSHLGRALLVVLAFLFAPEGRAQSDPIPADRSPRRQESVDAAEYRIGPGDVLRVFVWKEPELSGEVTVRLDGKVTVPLIGDMEAQTRTPEQFALEVSAALKRFVAAPQVTLAVVNASNARFFVLGQVARPGDFPLRGRTTVVQALALAGGFREFAKTDSIVIIRQDEGSSASKGKPAETLTVNYKKLEDGKDLAENLLLRPGDTVLVP